MRVESIEHYGEGFLINLEQGACAATHVVFANAAACLSFSLCEHFPLNISAGQISALPREHVRTKLQAIFCHRGYAIPAEPDYIIGATYDHDDISLTLNAENHHRNLSTLGRYAPGMVTGKPKLTQGRISHRVSARSRIPLIGRLLDAQGNVVNGAYTSLGHGSRGMISAPNGAEIIAAQIFNEPRPLSWK
jgi:tRNA 5-methylaminomethyl-2-thiouridine biosynthesis bifunctional protein